MKLDIVEYIENEGLPSQWSIEGCQLGYINLIVGKNATGKSRILKAINILADLLADREKIKSSSNKRQWNLIFNAYEPEEKIEYTLIIDQGQVTLENFYIGSKTYLERGEGGEGRIFAEELQTQMKFQTPTDKLAAVERRDTVQHPFFESLYNWAKSLRYYRFGTSLGKNSFLAFSAKKDIRTIIDFKDTDFVVEILKIGKEDFGDKFVESILSDMKSIGYDLSWIEIQKPSFLQEEIESVPFFLEDAQYLSVREHTLNANTEQSQMSQGMFRALSLIIQINYALFSREQCPDCILIDDIGEGLDYERSSALIKLLIEKAKTGSLQLIMTTNDRFIMNGVPLEYWSVIERLPGCSKLYNIYNSQDRFEEFELTGLNNFDFFSSDFYLEGFADEDATA
ncbi:ATP-binding protein [Planktothrix mougeotii LEGE 06226]|uniref:ATP-binding protein n=1 Tax=Planktothrix mougeotii LEGE 06226 TaxID=1828728 RepID=A0ABR9UCP6_9CYAN|nr:ATP-binding protein [Planktothrix mougeotii LEGE 06226]